MKRALIFFFIFIFSVSVFPGLLKTNAEVSAKSYVLIEASSGIVLSSEKPDEKREPASTTKILTALVAIENGNLDDVYKVSDNAAGIEGSKLGLKKDDELSLDDLLHILLMKSGNDAAVTIAENIAGSVDAFAELMNRKAESIGCKNSHFVNPHGLGNENHYTTAYDLALIASEALKNETFSKIVSSKTYTLDYKNLSISNSNKLLRLKDYFNGVKTGFTKSAGRCLVSSAEKNGVTLIAVTLNDGNDWDDHINLMEEGFSRVESELLYEAGEYKIEKELLNGNKTGVYVNSEDIYGVKIDGKSIKYGYSENIFPVIFSPAQKYSYGGYIGLVYENKLCGKVSVYLSETVDERETVDGIELFLYNLKKLLKKLL